MAEPRSSSHSESNTEDVNHMADIDPNLVWFLVGIMIVQGIWVAGLSYLMWKRHREQKKEEEATKST